MRVYTNRAHSRLPFVLPGFNSFFSFLTVLVQPSIYDAEKMTLADVNWTDFRLSLQTAYPDLNPRNRYSKQRLYEYIRQHSQARIRDELDVLRYYRHFNFLTKSLLDSHRLTEEERDQAFWYGFHPEDRDLMTSRLIALQPQRRAGESFELAEIFDTARAVFSIPLHLLPSMGRSINPPRSRFSRRRSGPHPESLGCSRSMGTRTRLASL
jgi:hypothetical protein